MNDTLQKPWTEALAALRADGWTVAVHNDYKLGGERFTFWMLANEVGWTVKGEGRSDQEAFDEIAAAIAVHGVVYDAAIGWKRRADKAEGELAMVDEALARRPALADAPDRYTAICRACDGAARADRSGMTDEQRAAAEHEFWNLFHHLWGLSKDGARYDQSIKDQWGQLQNMAQRLGLRRFDQLKAHVVS